MRHTIAIALSAATLACLLAAAPAAAAPSYSVSVQRDPVLVHRNDKFLTYTVKVRNTGSTEVGEKLTCSTATSAWTNAAAFTYQWLRDGVAIGGALAAEYTVAAADKGHSVQCEAIAANAGATTSSAALSAPLVVSPAPASPPPAPLAFGGEGSRPTIEGSGAAERTCTPPSAWSGSPSWSYQWLRNGSPIAGASAQKYLPGPEDANKVLQCMAKATNAAGAAAAISATSADGSPPSPPANNAGTPTLKGGGVSAAGTNLTIALPTGLKLYAGSGGGWSCHTAAATCTSSGEVVPGGEYPALKLEAWILPAEAPEAVNVAFAAYGGGAPSDGLATDSFTLAPAVPFGLTGFSARAEDQAKADYTQAGGHPFSATTSFAFATESHGNAVDTFRDVFAELPAGFVGNLTAVKGQACSVFEVREYTCPPASAVGGVSLPFISGTGEHRPLYQVTAGEGYIAAFAFTPLTVSKLTLVIRVKLRSSGDYGVTAVAPTAPQSPQPRGVEFVTICSYGAKLNTPPLGQPYTYEGCKKPSDAGANDVPFLTNPTRCGEPAPLTRARVDSWENPGALDGEGFPDLSDPNWKSYEAAAPPNSGCNHLDFSPTVQARPTTNVADAPSGLHFALHIPQPGLSEPEGLSAGDLRESVVTLPEGMAVNPAAAGGLQACSSAQIGLLSAVGQAPVHFSGAPAGCPAASKLGTVEVKTPLLDKPLEGSVYLAAQGDNPFGSLLALYIAVSDPETGIVVKLAGKVTPDPASGRLTARFDENPQVPFEDLDLEVFEGARAPLRTPPSCGTKTTLTEFTPYSAPESGPPATPADSFETSVAPGGGSCPATASQLPNQPRFSAGTLSPQAGSYSPFLLKLSREDGSQELKGLNAALPPGLTGRLAGVGQCSEADLAAATARSRPGDGALEQAHPSCPAASLVGSVAVTAGAGPAPFRATGRAYLAGPYKGAPLSLAIVTPAVAGPFDLGVVVVRSALYVDPETARIEVRSDPIPTILEGIPLDVRSIAVSVDRDHFTLNPTSCDPAAVAATAFGLSTEASLQSRFQLGGCSALPFAPKLALRLRGSTGRNGHPALTATLTQAEGQAGIASASVALPHSEFLDQGHIGTVCTRVQFAARECPPASVYGEAEALTPLLDQPLRGAVYLRSSSHQLPDLVVALRGPDSQPIEVDLDGRVDSVHGGIRNSFEVVPDAPVSKFVLRMRGGGRGLLVNSRNLCTGPARATVRFTAHNGKAADLRPLVGNGCGGTGGHRHRETSNQSAKKGSK